MKNKKEVNGIKAFFELNDTDIKRLYEIEDKLHFLNERLCERDLTEEEEAKREELEEEAKKILKRVDCFFFNNDPRGHCLKLTLAATQEAIDRGFYILKDWGGYGIIAP